MIIAVQDAEDILQEMSEASAAYKKILRNVPQGILPQGNYNAFRLLGDDDKVKEVTRLLQKSSVTNTTILLTGESGTGKTFIAGEIHKASRRSNGPFIHVNCAAIPYNLMESELFGYEEGAFTGAKKGGEKGYFEMAYGGTLFLDEIGEIPFQLPGKAPGSPAKQNLLPCGRHASNDIGCETHRGDQQKFKRNGKRKTLSRRPVLSHQCVPD